MPETEPQPQLRPAWGGIAGWALVIVAMALVIVGWDHLVNGLELLAIMLLLGGLSLLTGRVRP